MDCNNQLAPFVINNQGFAERGSYSENNLDVLKIIFSMDLFLLRAARGVSREWNNVARSIDVKQVIYNTLGFGPDQWAKYIGKEATAEEIRVALSMLPANIEQILCSPCPVFLGSSKLIKDTHVLVYIPQSVGGIAFTLTSLGDLLEVKLDQTKLRDFKGYRSIKLKVLKKHNNPVDQAHWMLMTKDVLEESRGKSYPMQKKMVEELSERSGKFYEVPQTLEAAAAAIAYFLKSKGEFIFNGIDPLWTYTRCKEEFHNGYHVIVGAFSPEGLRVGNGCDFWYYGVAGLRKFV